ncbi:type VI secretion system protein ImpH [Caldimonas brevitalea]|uniref:Type VI secretion system protein ImpH n=1 Tax=Caldimonas brevitalea TaxID=413882 RepID=A0A0G3BGU8_9BURK|nr:type VI secretion system protein ImpH [Caldimonas brevitalea]
MIDRLLADPHRFQFFQAVRLLERWSAKTYPQPQASGAPLQIVFRNSISLSFPASEIERLDVQRREADVSYTDTGRLSSPTAGSNTGSGGTGATADDLAVDNGGHSRHAAAIGDAQAATAAGEGGGTQGHKAPRPGRIERIEITPAFMGLLGSNGSLPLYYTETLARRELFQKDKAARAFLDVFQHRAVSLFYQAWKKHRLGVQYEADRRNRFLPAVLSIAGLGQSALRERMDDDGVHDESLAFFASTLQHRPISAGQMQQVLSSYFKVPAQIDQFVGRWYTLPPAGTTQLGTLNGVLGQSAVMGERVWQRDLRLRVVLGPLERARFQRFLPGQGGAKALEKLLTLMTGVCLEYEVRLQLRKEDVQGVTLSSPRAGADAASAPAQGRLGWDSFLQTRPSGRHRDDVAYEIHASA